MAERRVLVARMAPGAALTTPAILVGVESTPKRTFASALDWPGWSRSGRDEAAAIDRMASSMARYAAVAARAGHDAAIDGADLAVLERLPGTATTDYGAPDVVFAADGRPLDPAEADRVADLVRAAWDALDAAASAAPAGLMKGPRGGGRDRDAIVAHVVSAEAAYGRRIGLMLREPTSGDREAVEANRAAMLEVVSRPSDGGPLPGGRWPARYAARRIAWHAIDHAWEIEDRSAPGS